MDAATQKAINKRTPTGNDIALAFQQVAKALPYRIPISTYRLQFNLSFGFRDAAAIVSYLDALGITDVYSSPYFKAREGSDHGYDVVGHNALNPEVGSEEDHAAFAAELRARGMGQVLDIVPNHMNISTRENKWWMDVLENGPSSVYSRYFDIDWNPVKKQLQDRVILPILGDQYGTVLENQELRLVFEGGSFFVEYYDNRLPLEPKSYATVLSHGMDRLKEKLGEKDPYLQELLSIITAARNLPPTTARAGDAVSERMREKEVMKRRLKELYGEFGDFREFLDENVRLFNGAKGDDRSFDLIDGLLGEQVYRLAFWRVATEEINYRRFFDINDLAAIRMEDPEVFEEAHRMILKLLREGTVTGLRADHPDGLNNPKAYFMDLQRQCFVHLVLASMGLTEEDREVKARIEGLYNERAGAEPGLGKPLYIVGEKILIGSEKLPEDWPVYGTTGYVFMNSVGGVFVSSSNQKAMEGIYSRFIRRKMHFSDLLTEMKKLIMESSMSSEINVLAHALNLISESDRHFRDFTLNSLTDALVEVVAFFPVYRTYIDGPEVSERDIRYIDIAVVRAVRSRFDLGESIFRFIRDVLTQQYPRNASQQSRKQWLDFTLRFQQQTGPVMAKALEDTTFYIYNRLVSLNEVGGSPERFGTSVDAFHGQNMERLKHYPYTLNSTSTHDSKRSEDVRARISVLSELPGLWKESITRWSRINRKNKAMVDGKRAPDRNEEYLFYQTLLGAWPHLPMEGQEKEEFGRRISEYMIKALREAKQNTTWINPSKEYEDAVLGFVERALNSARFIEDFMPLQRVVSNAGMFNSLSQTLLKICSPGVPDFYQGTELWNLTLVDPDNRRPVDYALMVGLLDELKDTERSAGKPALCGELLKSREDGRIKLYLTYQGLNLRRRKKDLFLNGRYSPVGVEGEMKEHALAFMRWSGEDSVIAVAPRLIGGVVGAEGAPVNETWKDTRLLLPEDGHKAPGRFRNVFTDEVLETGGEGGIMLSEVLKDFPVAVLEGL